ncbi:MAG TPA: hypothetical protein VG148_02460, partial [Pyrinomonadaceae bacterium]|nr:hypothetical protein [Pyrinomonadaceae bacterium]
GEQRVELVDAGFEVEQFRTLLGDEIFAEAVLPVHLEEQTAEVADSRFPRTHQGAPLAPEDAARRRSPTGRRSR